MKGWRAAAAVLLAVACLWQWTRGAERTAHIPPQTPRCDLAPALDEGSPAGGSERARQLFLQTGLGPAGVSAVLGEGGAPALLRMQAQLYAPALWQCRSGTPLTRQETLDEAVQMAPLEDGDILVTTASHFFGWRQGHACLVVDAAHGETLDCGMSVAEIGSAPSWAYRANFVVLRLAGASRQERAAVAAAARRTLLGAPYNIAVGIFPAKGDGTGVTSTHCAHLVWSAYRAFGYDLDATGGPVVTPRDLLRSPLLEVVQVYGLDPQALLRERADFCP